MAEKAIRLGGESTADAIVSAVDSLYPEHTFEDKEFAPVCRASRASAFWTAARR